MEKKIVEFIYDLVSKELNVDFKDAGRQSEFVIARDIYSALCHKELIGIPLKPTVVEIGEFINRDHSAICTGSNRIENILFNNKHLIPVYKKLKRLVSVEVEKRLSDEYVKNHLIDKQLKKIKLLRTQLNKANVILDCLIG